MKKQEKWAGEATVGTKIYFAPLVQAAVGVLDTETATFGVRSFSFDSSAGFVLNGQSVKLHGGAPEAARNVPPAAAARQALRVVVGCVHHDNGPLGSKANGRAEER